MGHDDDDDDQGALAPAKPDFFGGPEEQEDGAEGREKVVARLRTSRRRSSLGSPVGGLEGFLKKGEYRAPTQCGCIPMRERRFKDKFVVLNLERAAVVYAKSRGQINSFSKSIPFGDIKSVALIDAGGRHFRIFLRSKARNKYKGREHFTFSAVDHDAAVEWVEQLSECAFLKCNVYTVGETEHFPERDIGVVPTTAVCFSGGGARAHVACMGQLRALFQMGLLNNKDISYISSVSGSAWATGIFTFYKQGAESDAQLLGPRTRLNELHMGRLAEDPPPLGKVATVEMWKLAESLFWSTASHEWWETTVGKTYLEPFGLNDDYTYAHPIMEEWLRKTNAGALRRVHFSHEGRPFWVANAAVLGPKWARAGDVVPVQFTPMYSGTPYLHRMRAHKKKNDHNEGAEIAIGGGMIDSFAFGSEEPEKASMVSPRLSLRNVANVAANAASHMVKEMFHMMESVVSEHDGPSKSGFGVHSHTVRVPLPERPLTLRHTLGISSHAPAFVFKNYALTARLTPRSLYWSPGSSSSPEIRADVDSTAAGGKALKDKASSAPEVRKAAASEAAEEKARGLAHEMDFADGGTVDNLGLLAMLQRKVPRILVCVNSEVKVPMKPKDPRTSARRSVRKIRRRSSLSSKRSSGVRSSLRGRVGEDPRSSANLDEEGFIFEEDEEVLDEAVSFVPSYEDWPQASILPLFGIEVSSKELGSFAHNQVFKKDKIVGLLEQLQRRKLNGEACIAVDTYEVMRNDWWGIKGGTSVTIMWYYLEKTRSFELQLPTETLTEIDRGLGGAFPRFPVYRTFGTRHGKWIDPSLTNAQVNLLSSLTEWSFMQSERSIKDFLRHAPQRERAEQNEAFEGLRQAGFA